MTDIDMNRKLVFFCEKFIFKMAVLADKYEIECDEITANFILVKKNKTFFI